MKHGNETSSDSRGSPIARVFRYRIDGEVISIENVKWDRKAPPVETLRNIIGEVEYWHQGSITSFTIQYRNAEGLWGGIIWNGERLQLLPIQAT